MLRRHLICLGLLGPLLACAALRAESPGFDWKQAAKAHEEAQKTGICEIHKMKMTAEAVPPGPGEPAYRYRMQHFPNYITVIEGGCCRIPGKNSEMTFICPKCKAEAIAWKSGGN
jgi:hypothetical protein